MHREQLQRWQHTHTFVSTDMHAGEKRTRWVIALTLTMMVAELYAGVVFGSMALIADGWHMASHGAALLVAAFAYAFARRHAGDPRFSFGTGKVGVSGTRSPLFSPAISTDYDPHRENLITLVFAVWCATR